MDKDALDVYRNAFNDYEARAAGLAQNPISIAMVQELGLGLEHGLSAEQLTFMIDHCTRETPVQHQVLSRQFNPEISRLMMAEIRKEFESGITIDQLNQYIDFSNPYISDLHVKMMCDLIKAGVSDEALEFMKHFQPNSLSGDSIETRETYVNNIDADFQGLQFSGNDITDSVADALKNGVDPERLGKAMVSAARKSYAMDGLTASVHIYAKALEQGLTDKQMDVLSGLDKNTSIYNPARYYADAIQKNKDLVNSLDEKHLSSSYALYGIAHGLNENDIAYLNEKLDNGMNQDKINILVDAIIESPGQNKHEELDAFMGIYENQLTNRELRQVMLAAAHNFYPVNTVAHMTNFKGNMLRGVSLQTGDRSDSMKKMREMLESGFSYDQVETYFGKNISKDILDACKNGHDPDKIMGIVDRYGNDAIKFINQAEKKDYPRSEIDLAFSADLLHYNRGTENTYLFPDISKAIDLRGEDQTIASLLYSIERWRNSDFQHMCASVGDIMKINKYAGMEGADRILKAATDPSHKETVYISCVADALQHNVSVDTAISIINRDYNLYELSAAFDAIEQGVTLDQIQAYYPRSGNSLTSGFNFEEMTKAIQSHVSDETLDKMAYSISREHSGTLGFDEARVQMTYLEGKYEVELNQNKEYDRPVENDQTLEKTKETGQKDRTDSKETKSDADHDDVDCDNMPKAKNSVRSVRDAVNSNIDRVDHSKNSNSEHNDYDDPGGRS